LKRPIVIHDRPGGSRDHRSCEKGVRTVDARVVYLL
jgi:hypothetical protein